MNKLYNLANAVRELWRYIRRVSGDDAYECYLSHRGSHHSDEPVLTRQQYYLGRLEQKSRGVNRCC